MKTGTRIGPYEILGSLGAGGMGEVYRARDARLQRDVAIKVLPESFANDADRLARFSREAQVLASLNHPRIAQVYGFEQSGAASALVMELVEGEDLATRIARGALPVDEALMIAGQITDALDVAHERGIVHRDLKPANIKLTPDGTVKVLDFGLAKALDQGPGIRGQGSGEYADSPTLTTPAMTRAGVIMGTAGYMSPEQARGKPVDKRADIWSFGVILYEMLTGTQLFDGETVSDTIAELLKRDIDLAKLPSDTPSHVRALLAKCLQRDPKKRLCDIGDAWLEQSTATDSAPSSSTRVGTPVAIGAVLGVAVVAAIGAWMLKPAPAVATPPVLRFSIVLAPQEQLRGLGRQVVAVAPDGSAVAIAAGRGILLRRLGDLSPTPLPNTDRAFAMTFAPDGQSLAYWADGDIRRLDLNGGSPQRLASVGLATVNGVNGLSWAPDGTIAFEAGGNIQLLGRDGNVKVLADSTEYSYQLPHFLPDGRALLYSAATPTSQRVVLDSMDGTEPVVLIQGHAPQFVPPNHLLFTRRTTLYQVALDVAARRVVGEPMVVQAGIAAGTQSQIPHFGVSRTGALFFLPGSGEGGEGVTLVSIQPNAEPVTIDAPVRAYSDLRLSPDGTRLAMHASDQQNDVWIREMARGTLTRLTYETGEDETPVWSPDGTRVAYSSERAEDKARTIRVKRADGTGDETVVWRGPAHAHVLDWSREGRVLVVEIIDATTRNDIMLLDINAPHPLKPYLKTPFQESSGRISPNGQWLAYMSNESGLNEIYVQSFPEGGNKLQVSLTGGTSPVWAPDGSRLFFRSPTDVMAVAVQYTPELVISKPQRLMTDTFGKLQGDTHTSYDAARNGTLIFTRQRAIEGSNQVVIHGMVNGLQ